MKKILIVGILSLSILSCTKDWECCVETTSDEPTWNISFPGGTSTHCIDFRGTNQEKDDFEAEGTKVYPSLIEPYTISQTTNCVID